jgi:hypothetical protein
LKGNLGIGDTMPMQKFTVQTDSYWRNNMVAIDQNQTAHGVNPSIRLYKSGGTENPCLLTFPWWIEANGDHQVTGEYGSLVFKTGEAQCAFDGSETVDIKFQFTRDGKLLLGDLKYTGSALTEPLKLSVDGAIASKEVLVTLSGWADYVFEEIINCLTCMNLRKLSKAKAPAGHSFRKRK